MITYGNFEYFRPVAIAAPLPLFLSCLSKVMRLSGRDLMIFTEAQLKSDEAIELKRKDLSKAIPHLPQTSDQYLYEISEIKAGVTSQLTDAIKESAFDCYIYSNGKCVNFGDPTSDKFAYVPDYADQQNDATTQANKEAIEWSGKTIKLNGVVYVYRRMGNDLFNIYDNKLGNILSYNK
jgi:hypothetical protein